MEQNNTLTTATQNLVIAFNSINKTIQYNQGQFTSDTYAAGVNQQIFVGKSRLVSITLLVTGGTVDIYDSAANNITPQSAWVATLDSTATLGTHAFGVECSNGIVLIISGSSIANITYSVA